MRTKLTKTSLLALLLFVFGAAGNAFAQFVPDPNAYYQIVEKNTQKCLDVSGGSLNVAPVGVWNCGSQTSQRWQLRFIPDHSVPGGFYQITAQHSSLSLDVQGGWFGRDNGIAIKQYPFNFGWNQEWALFPAGDDYYYIRVRHSGKPLTIIDGVGKQWDQTAGYNQKFKFMPYISPCS